MSATITTVRQLLDRTGEHPVISLYLDLDPEEFATPPARASQFRSLLDQAKRSAGDDASLDHDDRAAVSEDLDRLETWFDSGEPPFSGARALAVFASARDGLFEIVQLGDPAGPHAVIARRPFLEPLLTESEGGRWCVVLITRQVGRIFEGSAADLHESERRRDTVARKRRGGGLSHRNVQAKADQDADHHFKQLGAEIQESFTKRRFDLLLVGGPHEEVSRFVELLPGELRPLLAEQELRIDVESANEAELRDAVAPIVQARRDEAQRDALGELASQVGMDGRATLGAEATFMALTERRVQTLLLGPQFEDRRQEAVEAAIVQDAAVVTIEDTEEVTSELRRGQGIAALLRY